MHGRNNIKLQNNISLCYASKNGHQFNSNKTEVSFHFFRICAVSTRIDKGEMRPTDGQILH